MDNLRVSIDYISVHDVVDFAKRKGIELHPEQQKLLAAWMQGYTYITPRQIGRSTVASLYAEFLDNYGQQ